jgi:hypothetical protein
MASKRTVSLTKQLKAATTLAGEHAAHAEKLTKELAESKARSDSYYKLYSDCSAEIEQVHCLIDAFPNSTGRKSEPNEYGSTTKYNLMTRLAAWLANRSN